MKDQFWVHEEGWWYLWEKSKDGTFTWVCGYGGKGMPWFSSNDVIGLC